MFDSYPSATGGVTGAPAPQLAAGSAEGAAI